MASPQASSLPEPSVRHLRNCFRTTVIGDVRTGTFQTFWAAVGRRAPEGMDVSLDKPTSSRNSGELRIAFALVRAVPSAWSLRPPRALQLACSVLAASASGAHCVLAVGACKLSWGEDVVVSWL